MRPGSFMCGCPIGGNQLDAQKFRVCPEHAQREYGWRSGELVQTANGRRAAYHHPPDFTPGLELAVAVPDRRENSDAHEWVQIPWNSGNGIGHHNVIGKRTDLSRLRGKVVSHGRYSNEGFREHLFAQEKQAAAERVAS